MNDMILAHNTLLYDIDTKFHYVIYFVWFRYVVIIIPISVHN